MKARVKTLGLIVEVTFSHAIHDNGHNIIWYKTPQGDSFTKDELEFIIMEDDFDYWTRLEHQYAGMAMQSYISNNVYLREIREMCKEPQEMRDLIADLFIFLATTLVEKLKEKEERK